jgi:hypothetical protein
MNVVYTHRVDGSMVPKHNMLGFPIVIFRPLILFEPSSYCDPPVVRALQDPVWKAVKFVACRAPAQCTSTSARPKPVWDEKRLHGAMLTGTGPTPLQMASGHF